MMSNKKRGHSHTGSTHWSHFARSWSLLGPPLRPAQADVDIVSEAVRTWSHEFGPPRTLILGVTPELCRMQWPPNTDLVAVDHNQEMIDAVWPGPRNAALCADWTDMPLPDASRDIVVCDGGLILIPHPDGHLALVKSLSRVIAPNGVLSFRLFAPGQPAEDPSDVLEDLLAGRVRDLNALKLRLWVSLQNSLSEGVPVRRIWDAIHAVAPDLDELAAELGWPADHVHVLDLYEDSSTRYCFPTVDDVRRMFCIEPGGFVMESVTVPTYDLGDRCPTVVLRRTGDR